MMSLMSNQDLKNVLDNILNDEPVHPVYLETYEGDYSFSYIDENIPDEDEESTRHSVSIIDLKRSSILFIP